MAEDDLPGGTRIERGPYRDEYLTVSWDDENHSIVAYTHDGYVIRFPRGADPSFSAVQQAVRVAGRVYRP